MNFLSKIIKEAVENEGEVELRIRITRDTTIGELIEKIPLLLSIFPPEQISVIPVKRLKEKELEIFKAVMNDYEDKDKSYIKIQGETYEDRS